MSRHLIPTPMPEVLSVTAVAEAEAAFGAGSELAAVARRHIDGPHVYPQPTAEQVAADQRARVADALATAFLVVGQCVALVEAHTSALFDVDAFTGLMRSEWRYLAHQSLAALHARSPELLPIGPAVHADCHGGDW